MIDFVIISYNTLELLKKCIVSIFNMGLQDKSADRVIVVDNASVDDSPSHLRQFSAYTFGTGKIILNTENVGYAKAVNQGIGIGDNPFVILMNADTRLLRCGTITLLISRLKKNIGIIGPKLLNTQGQIVGAGVNGVDDFFSSRGFMQEADAACAEECDVMYISGAFMLFRRSLWEAMGGFDEEFFFYFEDADFCLRAARMGYRTRFIPEPVFHHLGASPKPPEVNEQFESAYALFRKKHPEIGLGEGA